MRRKMSLAVTAVFLVTLALACQGCGHTGASRATGIKDDFKPNLEDPKLKEKLGNDDGYSLAVIYGGDTHGSLETCG